MVFSARITIGVKPVFLLCPFIMKCDFKHLPQTKCVFSKHSNSNYTNTNIIHLVHITPSGNQIRVLGYS